jgi:hypothetical protein
MAFSILAYPGKSFMNGINIAMGRRRYPLQPLTKLFLATLGLTVLVWVLRGLSVLAFVPGLVIWALILLCFGLGIVSSLQRIR